MSSEAAATTTTEEKKEIPKMRVKGSCHCKYITYEVDAPIEGTVSRCNCTMCQKPGFMNISLDKEGTSFTLLTPSSESEVKSYSYRSKECFRFFCDKCGIQVWSKGRYDWDGHEIFFFNVNLLTVDQPQEGFEVNKFKVNYFDGLGDTWAIGDKPFPGGIA